MKGCVTRGTTFPLKKLKTLPSLLTMSAVIVTDTRDTLEVHHYDDQCSFDSPDEVKEKRGIVTDTATGRVVCRSFPFTPEILEDDVENLTKWVQPLVDNSVPAYKSWEGTLLRVWNWNGEWTISTHRKLNAFKSRWGSEESYGKIFQTALGRDWEIFTSGLNPARVYIFLLRSGKNNRVVCSAYREPSVFIVGAFHRGENDEWNYVAGSACSETGVGSPERVQYETLEDLLAYKGM